MRHIASLAVVTAALSLLVVPAAGQSETRPAGPGRRPNILIILADDLGYADLGCQGGDVRTPHIDSLAASGIRFTDGYVSGPVCSPTRAGLLTGRYQQRFGHEFNARPPHGMPRSEKTIADYLRSADYVTGLVGKWHLGAEPAMLPPERGFEHFFGFPQGAHSYIEAGIPSNPILRNTAPVEEEEYLTDAFNREAVAFIERPADRPFFLYLAYNAIHTPLQAPEPYRRRFPSETNERRRTMLAMLSAMDDGVGRVLETLRQRGLEENTLIFLFSDNGGPTRSNMSRNTPLNGFKGQLLEGGIRVPFIIQWKGRLPEGRVYRQPVISLDVLPTALAAAGVDVPGGVTLDGVNLLPFLSGRREGRPHEQLFWRFGPSSAIRSGDHKLLILPDGKTQLFDLAADMGEQHDLSGEHPERVQRLRAALRQWDAQLADPLWPSSRERRQRPNTRRQRS